MRLPRFSRPLARAVLALAVSAAAVGWSASALAETVTVQGVTWDAGRQAYVVNASGELAPRVTRLDHPDRLVIDLPNAKLAPSHQALEGIAGSGISRVRVGQFQANTTRIVFDLTRPVKLDVETGGHELVIPVRPSAAQQTSSAGVVNTPTIRALRHRAGEFQILMSQRSPYWSHVRPGGGAGQPVHYLVVFPNTKLASGAIGTQAIDARGVQRVTCVQNGTEARLEFEMSKAPTFDVQARSWGWRFAADGTAQAAAAAGDATPAPAPSNAVTTAAATPRPRKTPERIGSKPTPTKPINRRPTPTLPETGPAWNNAPDAPLALRKIDGHWQMLLTADSRFKYRTSAVGDDRIHIDIDGGKVALPRDSVYIDNGLIARVRVTPGQGGGTRLTIDLDQPIRHTARLQGNQRSLLMGFHRLGKDRVTLDPGHGGSDSGTVGQKGTKEKDVTLAIATKLARVMEANGMSVQMTRMKDLEILLRPRVEMANRNDADVFVSIHANSFGSQHGVNGIETYYFTDDSLPLARSIHKSLLRSLGRPDRGVRKNNFYVVHHTKMPAALIEIGYLSNAEEEALLSSPAYQERAAQAIYAGIREFQQARKANH